MPSSESNGLFGAALIIFAGGFMSLQAEPPTKAVSGESSASGAGKSAAAATPSTPDKLPPPGWGARLTPGPPSKSASVPASESQAEQPPPLVVPLVQGYDSFGLNIPEYDPAGNLRSIFSIGAVSKVDDRLVEIRDSFFETYKDDGSRDFSIELPKAQLDRVTRILVAKIPVVVRRAEFEVRGATLEFNTYTKEGGFGGPVEMTIYSGLGGPANLDEAPDSKKREVGGVGGK